MTELTVKEARKEYFRSSGLPLDGGYDDKWIPLKFGFLTIYVYNSLARKRAVRLHDIHHVLTGYKTDPRGEASISAWELSAGIYDKHFARFINLAGLFYGAFLFPKTTFAAFVRGSYSRSLYNREYCPSILEQKVSTLRNEVIPEHTPEARLTTYIYYIFLVGVACTPAAALCFVLYMLVLP